MIEWKPVDAPLALLSKDDLRDCLISAHGMATGRYVQSDTVMRQRIGNLLEKAISADDVMRGFLGYGGLLHGRDLATGSGSLADEVTPPEDVE